MVKNEKSTKQLKKILEQLDNAINDLDGAYTQNYHYDSEIAKIGDSILASRTKLKNFIDLIEE